MRLDHVAYRVADRHKTADFFVSALGYKIADEFEPKFDDGSKVKCLTLEPPEKPTCPQDLPPERMVNPELYGAAPMEFHIPWTCENGAGAIPENNWKGAIYHMAAEVFISDGDENSIVGKWVAARDGIGGIHHLAYQVDSVSDTMQEWKDKGWAEFTTEDPLTCPDLVQCFTKPSELTGVIFEFIERGKNGFCVENVAALMESTT